MKTYKLWIDGKPAKGSGVIKVINPATEEVFAEIERSDKRLVDQALDSAKGAQIAWSRKSISERQSALAIMADKLRERAHELAELLTHEQGKPINESKSEVDYAINFITHFSTMDLPVEVIINDESQIVESYRKPLGVVATIIPWNFPLLIIAFKVPLALLAGNACIVKPASTTPLTCSVFAEICSSIFPPGLVNTVNDEDDLGQHLTTHPAVDKISFTGSTATGKKVLSSSVEGLKRVTLELGGNDPAIVLPDVNVQEVARSIFSAAFVNCGQACLAVKRVYIHKDIYEEMCTAMVSIAENTVVGDGKSYSTELGPVCNRMQYEKVVDLISSAEKDGKILTGGQLNDKGFYIRPTIVRDVSNGDEIVDCEQFGPILPLIQYASIDEAVDDACDSPFGLGASVWSNDVSQAKEIALRLDSGTVWVNKHLDVHPGIPFAGAKQSGIGVEFAEEGLKEFTQLQIINISKR